MADANEKYIISVIVPVYNVENYLRRCINSILDQTYDAYEVILVDDGSTDRSGNICDEYAHACGNITVYHQMNRGQSSARNFGVQMARGAYIAFVDSDDWVSKNYLSYLYEMVEKFQVDIAGAKMKRLDSYDENFAELNNYHVEECLTTAESLKKMCYGDSIGVSPCAKIYKKELLLQNPYPVGKIHEDVDTTYKIISSCPNMAVGTQVIYYYFQRSGSTIHQRLMETQFYGMEAALNLLKYMQSNYPEVEHAAHIRCAMKAIEYVPMLLMSTEDQKKSYDRIRSFLKPHMHDVKEDDFVSDYFKIRCFIVMLGFWPLKILWPMLEMVRKLRR